MRQRRGSRSISRFRDTLYFLLTLLPLPLLLTNASYFVSGNDEDGTETAGYCRLCERHTMCLFPFDDVAPQCIDVENGDLDPEEIRSIVHEHNVQRNNIARGQETRGNPGPQPSARNMMELTWDDELAQLARKWALQCNTNQKDHCRDVERFEVWQNVNVLEPDDIAEGIGIVDEQNQGVIENDGNTTSGTAFMRIRYHVQSWLNDVENFDNSRVGLVDFSNENESSYVAIAGAKITRMGCGRAMYSVNLDEATGTGEVEVADSEAAAVAVPQAPEATGNKNDTVTGRVEVLVCNYGPIDRTTPQNLYEDGALEDCPEGSVPSNEYDHLCTTTEDLRELSPRDSEDRSFEDGEASLEPSWHDGIVGSPRWDEDEERRRSSGTSSAVSIALRKSTSASGISASFYVLVEFLSLLLLHIITKSPGARCC